jgi:hypothetical protein
LLVSQNFYRQGDRYRQEGNEKFDKYITDGIPRWCSLRREHRRDQPDLVSRRSSTCSCRFRAAPMPGLGSKATDSKHVRLEPFTTQSFEYFFYFPAPNAPPEERFPHYPVVLAKNEQVVGAAKPFSFHVVGKAHAGSTKPRGITFRSTAARRMSSASSIRITLSGSTSRGSPGAAGRIVEFYRKLGRSASWPGIASTRRSTATRCSITTRRPCANGCATATICSINAAPGWIAPWSILDPIERKRFEQLDYAPVVNQRTHRLGSEYRIANNVVLGQYRGLLDIPQLQSPRSIRWTRSAWSAFLFVQDRVEEALTRFKAVKADALPTRIQHDYLRCYAAFYDAKPRRGARHRQPVRDLPRGALAESLLRRDRAAR